MQRSHHLDSEQVAEVSALAEAVAAADGVAPCSEPVLLALRHGGGADRTHLLLRRDDGVLCGYAQVWDSGGATAELAVHPDARRQGRGRALAEEVVAVAGGDVRAWAHGDHPAAAALARRLGFTRARVLFQLRRPLTDPVPAPTLPPGVRLRTFEPGRDDSAWLALNARAFADHPEQGRWTEEDLRARMAEPWFDPAGFLLAERDGALIGFHWTKVHPEDPPLGEVYVLGVDPQAHGHGLGKALTLAGLRHLRDRGLTTAMLYVDETNTPAVALYHRLGFTRWSTDVMYARVTPDEQRT